MGQGRAGLSSGGRRERRCWILERRGGSGAGRAPVPPSCAPPPGAKGHCHPCTHWGHVSPVPLTPASVPPQFPHHGLISNADKAPAVAGKGLCVAEGPHVLMAPAMPLAEPPGEIHSFLPFHALPDIHPSSILPRPSRSPGHLEAKM